MREESQENHSKLFGRKAATVKERKRIWEKIAENVSAVSEVQRTPLECQKRWNDDKRMVKQKTSSTRCVESERTGEEDCGRLMPQKKTDFSPGGLSDADAFAHNLHVTSGKEY